MTKSAHELWLLDLIGTDSVRYAAEKAGYAQSTISRQLGRGSLSHEMVIALCRAYDHSPVYGLIETGYLHDFEVDGPAVAIALRDATNQHLLDEIIRRSDPDARVLFGPDDSTVGLAPDAQVFSMHSDEDVHWEPYAANRREREAGPGDDNYHGGA